MLADLVQHRPEALPADLLAMMRYIDRKSAVDLGAAAARIARTGEQLTALCSGFDALLLPTAPQTAFAMDQPAPANQADFTGMANMNGAPAISLPLPVAADSLPVGLQLIGHRGHDLDLLQLAAQIEALLSAA
jgi:aspartyl-tRNA(Asn)/glutamyl-tRNA(Gln) amidotransferase subunit A